MKLGNEPSDVGPAPRVRKVRFVLLRLDSDQESLSLRAVVTQSNGTSKCFGNLDSMSLRSYIARKMINFDVTSKLHRL